MIFDQEGRSGLCVLATLNLENDEVEDQEKKDDMANATQLLDKLVTGCVKNRYVKMLLTRCTNTSIKLPLLRGWYLCLSAWLLSWRCRCLACFVVHFWY